jgi:hypothetical protein
VGDPHENIAARSGRWGAGGEIQRLVFQGRPIACACWLLYPSTTASRILPYMTEAIGSFDLTLAIEKPRLCCCAGCLPDAKWGQGVGPRQKFERKHRIEPDLGSQTQCLIGILFPLSRKTNNHIGGNGAVPL